MPDKIILGFDVGSHKIGVAVGQTLTRQAQPLSRIQAHHGLPHVDEIHRLLAQWQPQIIVVGLPTMMSGKKQFTTDLALNFMDFLKTLSDIPVMAIDERLTTKVARSELFEQGGFKKLQKADVDSYAAKLIVESWMQEN